MSTNLKNWYHQLQEANTLANHKKCIEELEQIYLDSSAANCQKQRRQITWLLRYLKKIM